MNVVFALDDHPLRTTLLAEWARERPLDRLGLLLLPRARPGPGEPGRLGWALMQWCLRRLAGIERDWPSPGRWARAAGIDRLAVPDLQSPDALSFVKQRHCDLLLSWDQPRQPEALSSLPKLGTINAHPGAQPGPVRPWPWLWELGTGAGRLSLVLHRPSSAPRLGPQLAEAWSEADPGSTPFLHHYQAVQVASRLFPVVSEELEKGEVAEIDAAGESESFAVPDAELLRRLAERGHPRRSLREAFALLAGRHDGFVAHHERVHAADPT